MHANIVLIPDCIGIMQIDKEQSYMETTFKKYFQNTAIVWTSLAFRSPGRVKLTYNILKLKGGSHLTQKSV